MQSYGEADCRDLLQLVVRRLASGGGTEIGEGARHEQLFVHKGCPKHRLCPKGRPAIF